jgi:hypothetical protein
MERRNYLSDVESKETKFGRPKKEQKFRRSKVVKLSLTEDEYALIQQRAEAFGYIQIARYIHDDLMGASRENVEMSRNIPTLNIDAVSQLMGACNNLNQIARRLNAAKEGDDLSIEQVVELVRNVGDLAGICILSVQGKDDDVTRALQMVGRRSINCGVIGVAINGPTPINLHLSNEIKTVLDSVKAWRMNPAVTKFQIENELEKIRYLMIGVVYLLQGMNEEGLNAIKIAKTLSRGV